MAPNSPHQRFLQIDEEGYPHFEGLRIVDEELGQSIISSLKYDEAGILIADVDGTLAVVENFDAPLVARHVEKQGTNWFIILPYHCRQEFGLSSINVDEWDRFHGRTVKNLPFVMSRTAQMEFFDLVDSFTDQSVTADQQEHVLPPWPGKSAEVSRESYWSKRYVENNAGWDLGGPSPVFTHVIPQLKLPKCRVAVLGCGYGHDAALFAQLGNHVTAVDISPKAINQARSLYGHLKNLELVESDIFSLPEEFNGAFDLVVEHTCFCAIDPGRRNELIRVWKKLLSPTGQLLAIFFMIDPPSGPPFGSSEWEIRERLKGHFNFLYWSRWRQSVPRRTGQELVIFAQRKSH